MRISAARSSTENWNPLLFPFSGICRIFFSALGFGVRGVLAFGISCSLFLVKWCGHALTQQPYGCTSLVAGYDTMINLSGCGSQRNCPQKIPFSASEIFERKNCDCYLALFFEKHF